VTAAEASFSDLTPAEALALLDGPHTNGRLALKLTLLDLMADGLFLLMPDVPPVTSPHLVAAHARPTTANPYLISPAVSQASERLRHRAAVVRALALSAPPGTSGSFRSSRQFLRVEFGADASGFVSGCLLPDLVGRGLLTWKSAPRFLLGWWTRLLGQPAPRAQMTPVGTTARAHWTERREAARLLAQDLHDRTDAAARREDLEAIALLAVRADAAVLLLDDAFTSADYRLIRRGLIERAGMSTAMRLPRLLALAEHHGRRLSRGLSLPGDGIDHLTPHIPGTPEAGF